MLLNDDPARAVRPCPPARRRLFGIPPRRGPIPLEGCMDLAPSSETFGVLARRPETVEAVAAVLPGPWLAARPASPA